MKKGEVSSAGKRRRTITAAIGGFLLVYIGVIVVHTYKSLPEGIEFEGELHTLEDVEMLYDLTYAQDQEGSWTEHELRIFEEIYDMIENAEEFIVMDFFLFNGYIEQDMNFPEIAETLTKQLISKKEENADFPVYFITDPINNGYGSYESELLGQLDKAGVEVIYTELAPLRDSMPLYSGLYRMFFQWFDSEGDGWLPNALSSEAPEMTLSSYIEMMNIKANHRKTLITESGALVSSANPHNESGFHGNMAFKVSGPILNDMLEAEEAVSLYSGGPAFPRIEAEAQEGIYEVQYLTEKKILDALLDDIEQTTKGDSIQLAMFYLAEPDVIDALVEAANRNVEVRLILDPNENAFGNDKTGLPNRPVVHEMKEEADENRLHVRWYNTVIGQFHTKTIMIEKKDELIVSAGAANFTERALKNYNLESNLRIKAPADSDLSAEMNDYFDRLWNNEDALYTLEVEEYQSNMSFWQRGIYGFQKVLKLTTY